MTQPVTFVETPTVGLCECGCGNPTPIAKYTDSRRGWVKGQPLRFIFKHVGKVLTLPVTKGYRTVNVHERVVGLHVARAERALGRSLPQGAVVHHADGSKGDQAPLVICESAAYHRLLHIRMRVKAAGGNPNTQLICCHCKQLKLIEEFNRERSSVCTGRCSACRTCANEKIRRWRARRRPGI